jgi:hypothetical protein
MALGMMQPLTEISAIKSFWGGGGSKVRPMLKAENLTDICEPDCLENVGSSASHNPICLNGLLQGKLYSLLLLNLKSINSNATLV